MLSAILGVPIRPVGTGFHVVDALARRRQPSADKKENS
jgi:hypothetical protein